MRVVHALGWYFPESLGGTEVYVAALTRELQHAGIDVRIAAPAPGASAPSVYEHEGIPVFRYPTPAHPTRAEARGESVTRGTERFHEWLGRERPDVVHIHTFVTGLDLIEVTRARALGARVYVTSHSSALGYVCLRGTLLRWGTDPCDGVLDVGRCTTCALDHRGVPRLLARAAAAMPSSLSRVADQVNHPLGTALGMSTYIARRAERQRQLFEQIDGFFALTDAARAILLANGAPEAKVRLNRLGVDSAATPGPAAVTSRHTRSPVKIGYLGRWDPIKGIDDLRRALEALDPGVPIQVEIRGAGGGADAARIRSACEALAARDRRVVIGSAVPRHEVARLLASWDLLCCPGRSLEGGPTVALEAFAARTPVIGTRFGGLAEIVDDGVNGALVAPGDWRALANIIRAVADEPDIVNRWRAQLPPVRTMRDVTADYLAAYQSCAA